VQTATRCNVGRRDRCGECLAGGGLAQGHNKASVNTLEMIPEDNSYQLNRGGQGVPEQHQTVIIW
jgi:hypothetical protein